MVVPENYASRIRIMTATVKSTLRVMKDEYKLDILMPPSLQDPLGISASKLMHNSHLYALIASHTH